MSETPSTAVAVQPEVVRNTVFGIAHAAGQSSRRVLGNALVHTTAWAGDTAQQFGTLLSDLLAPVVFTMYALTAWSLTNSFGWTDTFVFSHGPLSSWLVWLSLAILLNVAANILRRCVSADSERF